MNPNLNLLLQNIEVQKEIPNISGRTYDGTVLTVSQEGMSDFLKNVGEFFGNKIEVISAFFSKSEQSVNEVGFSKNYNQFIVDLITLKKDIPNIINKVNFSDVENLSIPIMMGMKSDLLTTVSQLKMGMKIVHDNLLKELDNTDTIIAKVMSDKEYRTSTRPTEKEIITRRELVYELEKVLRNIIDPRATVDNKPLKAILNNLSSIEKIYDDIMEIGKGTSLKDFSLIQTKLKNLSERSELLYDTIVKDKEMEISKQVIDNVSESLQVTGMLVTDSITLFHIYNQAATTLRVIIERIKK